MRGRKIISIVILSLMVMSIFLFFSEEVEAPTIDYITLTDAPNGTELTTVVLEAAQHCQDRAGVDLVGLARDLRQHPLHRAQLITLIIDHEVAFVAQLLDVSAEDPP